MILRKHRQPRFLRTQYQILIETEIRKIELVLKNDNDELELERYPTKKTQFIEKPEIVLFSCLNCERKTLDWLWSRLKLSNLWIYHIKTKTSNRIKILRRNGTSLWHFLMQIKRLKKFFF